MSSTDSDLKQELTNLLVKSEYIPLIELCEEHITIAPETQLYYWYLGLAYLLQDREDEAQTAWWVGISQQPEESSNLSISELVDILDAEAKRQTEIDQLNNAWLIRQHIREISPEAINNILELALLSIITGEFDVALVREWSLCEYLREASPQTVDRELLIKTLAKILSFPSEEALEVLDACRTHVEPLTTLVELIITTAVMRAQKYGQYLYAVKLLETSLEIIPDYPRSIYNLPDLYSHLDSHQKALQTAEKYYAICTSIPEKVTGSFLILRTLMTAGNWQQAKVFVREHEGIINEILSEPFTELSAVSNRSRTENRIFMLSAFFAPYIEDNARKNRILQNRIAESFQKQIRSLLPNATNFKYPVSNSNNRKLKIGYIAHTLKDHSVGWLSRWLFHHHDRDNFEINIYCINQNLETDFSKEFFRDKVDVAYSFEDDSPDIARQINEDGIDILVDLDSITLDQTCEIMALKPAPIQVSWLGWDASGIPAIDYYIADNYVLPNEAQEYYQETIWRLPGSYVAVDGFEVGIPTITRGMLDIPANAVIYLSAQKGYKRHPDTIKWQVQILKEVPNSYLLVKGLADELTIQKSFNQIAEEVGVNPDRLRFLARDKDEYTHRANLTIADVVLDTYPYNGATTTLETLWMGIPMVTRVGEQFSARNSYTFLKNAGIEEGIAWTDEEYVEWGVRLGKDQALRWEIAGKLRASRQTSPLWNAKKFTQEMENAYRQMWAKYVGG